MYLTKNLALSDFPSREGIKGCVKKTNKNPPLNLLQGGETASVIIKDIEKVIELSQTIPPLHSRLLRVCWLACWN